MSAARTRKTATLVIGAVALLGAQAVPPSWFSARGGRTRPGEGDSDSADATTPRLATAAPPVARSRTHSAPKAPPSTPSEPERVRVHGTVRTADGDLVGAGEVYLHDLARGVVGSVRVGEADGPSYSLALPLSALSGDRLTVGFVGTGYARASTSVAIPAAGDYAVDLAVARGHTVSGRIVDAAGRGISGLPLTFTTALVTPHSEWGPVMGEGPERARASADSTYAEGRAATDADGRFVVRGLAPGPYGIVSSSTDWLLEPTAPVRAPHDGEVVVLAHPTYRLLVDVRNARDRRPIGDFALVARVLVPGQVPYPIHLRGYSGRAVAFWRSMRGGREDGGFRISVPFQAVGWRATERSVEYAPGDRSQELQVAVDPEETGILHVRVRDPDGRPFGTNVTLFLSPSGAEPGSADAVLEGRSESRGQFQVRVNRGEWDVEVSPGAGGWVALPSWKGRASVVAGAETSIDARIPAHGTLRFRRTAGTPPEVVRLLLLRPEGRSRRGFTTLLERHEDVKEAIAESGSWQYVATIAGSARRWTGSVIVPEGGEPVSVVLD